MQDKPHLNLLGIALRANKLVLGESSIVEAVRQNQAKLVLIASDASDNTKKKLSDKSTSYQVPYIVVEDRHTLSKAIGKDGRVAVAITDQGFANKLKQLLSD
ncbi:YlxQ family RNA-binding protein [Halalkalibacillus halophilus]|uniref:YlxQ family RNA-binding protein n=1 Tax=Halalkalibacillus halophilus TaxID=392827 RepID=UPI00040551DD